MNYELAKELKGGGFPQRWINGTFYMENDVGSKSIFKHQRELKFVDNSHKFIAIPVLSELIEACGKKFRSITLFNGVWEANADEIYNIQGKTPEEAIARLWLALNKK